MKERIAIIDGIRTPFCKSGGKYKTLQADDLGAIVLKELVARTNLDVNEISEVIFGNVAQPIHAANIARVITLKAHLPESLIAYTVQRNCASGMEAITTAANKILADEADVIIAGGTESMTHIPLIYNEKMTQLFAALFRAKTLWQRLKVLKTFRLGFLKPIIGLQQGLSDSVIGLNMGQTAEILAREFAITREDQDRFSLRSHRRACNAIQQQYFKSEIVPVPIPPKYNQICSEDDGPRAQQTIEALQKLRPYFDRLTGTVTAGNASQITDGASAVLLMKESRAQAMGYTPLGYLKEYAYAALPADHMGLGPAYATAKLFDKSQLSMDAFDLVEMNEAFASQVIANERAFTSKEFGQKNLGRSEALGEINPDLLNVNGGAIALGHPVGTSGTRLVLTLLRELRRREKQLGLATLCVGGGQGAALAVEVN